MDLWIVLKDAFTYSWFHLINKNNLDKIYLSFLNCRIQILGWENQSILRGGFADKKCARGRLHFGYFDISNGIIWTFLFHHCPANQRNQHPKSIGSLLGSDPWIDFQRVYLTGGSVLLASDFSGVLLPQRLAQWFSIPGRDALFHFYPVRAWSDVVMYADSGATFLRRCTNESG